MAATGEAVNSVPIFMRSLVGAALLLCLGVVVLGAYARAGSAALLLMARVALDRRPRVLA
jgi:hypothetical protein